MEITFGNLLSESVRLIKKHIVHLVLLSLFMLLLSLPTLFYPDPGVVVMDSTNGSQSVVSMPSFFSLMIYSLFILLPLSVVALTVIPYEMINGHKISYDIKLFKKILAITINKYFRLLFATLLCFLAVGLGLISLVIPGIYLMLKLAFVMPNIILRDQAVGQAFSSSFQMTKGKCWLILGMLLFFMVVNFIFFFILGLLTAILINSALVVTILTQFFSSLLGFLYCFMLLLLFKYVAGHEGTDHEPENKIEDPQIQF